MTTLPFAKTHNLVAFLDKPAESEGFEQIVDFLNASSIRYALTVNPTIYTSCTQQFWATVKVKTVNGEVQLQALVDGKKIIITKSIIRRDLQLEDAEGIDWLPNAGIFEQLTLMWYEKLSQKLTFYKAFFSPQWKFLIHTILQCLSAKTTGSQQEQSDGSANPTNPEHIPTIAQPSSSQPQRNINQGSCVPSNNIAEEAINEENVPTHSNDPLLSGEDRLKLKELIALCTSLQNRVLDLEHTKTTQALEIDILKRRVKKLKKKQRSRTHGLRRLYKVGLSAWVISSEDEGLGEEDASKQGRKIHDIDTDEDITLDNVHDEDMFDTVATAGEVVTTANVKVSAVSLIAATITTDDDNDDDDYDKESILSMNTDMNRTKENGSSFEEPFPIPQVSPRCSTGLSCCTFKSLWKCLCRPQRSSKELNLNISNHDELPPLLHPVRIVSLLMVDDFHISYYGDSIPRCNVDEARLLPSRVFLLSVMIGGFPRYMKGLSCRGCVQRSTGLHSFAMRIWDSLILDLFD
ncbi:hypothetical protein Tco_0280766 [Tanacetum coccineum]